MSSTTDREMSPLVIVPDEPEVEVIYLTPGSDGQSTGTKKRFLRSIQLVLTYGIPIMCVALAIAGRFRILFTVGALFGVQSAYFRYRYKRFEGPLVDDADMRARISPPLIELCVAAKCPVPQVQIKRTRFPAAMGRIGGRPTLWISPDFLDVADDSALRAILSHEVVHLQRDIPVLQKRRAWPGLVLWIGWLAFYFGTGNGRGIWIYVALFFAFLLPAGTIIAFFAGFSRRKRETRADLEGAAAIGNSDDMVRALTAVYSLGPEMRRRIFGPKALRWMFFPYSLPSKIHPPLKKRVADLRAMSVSDVLAASTTNEARQAKSKRYRLAARLVFGVCIFVLILVFHHGPFTRSVSRYVESPGGAHFIPLQNLGLKPLIVGFAPLSHNQRHDVFITSKQAVSEAESSVDVQPADATLITVAEGNINDASQIGAFYPTPSKTPDWQAAYIVVFSGPNLAGDGSSAENVVEINAYQGTVLNSFINETVP